jgi:hypothetical protein
MNIAFKGLVTLSENKIVRISAFTHYDSKFSLQIIARPFTFLLSDIKKSRAFFGQRIFYKD